MKKYYASVLWEEGYKVRSSQPSSSVIYDKESLRSLVSTTQVTKTDPFRHGTYLTKVGFQD